MDKVRVSTPEGASLYQPLSLQKFMVIIPSILEG